MTQQVGKFSIAANVYTSWTMEEYQNYFGSNFMVYKGDYNYVTKKFEFLAYSPLFTAVDETVDIPTYNITFDTEDVVTTVTEKKYHAKLNTSLSNSQMNVIAQTAVASAVASNVTPSNATSSVVAPTVTVNG